MVTEQPERKRSNTLFLLISMSTTILLVSPVAVLVAVGYFADKYFHTAPIFLIGGGIIGFASGISNVFRMTQMMQRRKKQTNETN